MKSIWKAGFLAFLLAAGGCTRESEVPILSVNGRAYTQADWDCDIAVREALYSHKQGAALNAAKAKRQHDGIRLSTLQAFVNDTLWQLALGATNDSIRTQQSFSGVLSAIQDKYTQTFGRPGETFDDLVALLPNARARQRLRTLVAQEAVQEAFCMTHYRDDYEVSSNLVATTLRQISEMNRQVGVTNRQIYASASNLVARLRAGEDFARLADRFSQESPKEAGGALGECDKNDFPLDGDKIWPILSNLKVGEVTDPLETEDGLCIYRCDAVVPESEKTGEFALRLSRICFYRAVPGPELTFEQCRRQLARERRQDVTNRILATERGRLEIRLPQGRMALPKPFLQRFRKFIQNDTTPTSEVSK